MQNTNFPSHISLREGNVPKVIKNLHVRAGTEEEVIREMLLLSKVRSKYLLQAERIDTLASASKDITCTVQVTTPYYPKTLKDVLKEELSFKTVVRYVYEIYSGLVDMHGIEFLHLDLKPENIFLSKENNIILGDFGLASWKNGKFERLANSFVTKTYRAPELLLATHHRVDTYTDLYAAGSLVWELISGNSQHSFGSQVVGLSETKKFEVKNMALIADFERLLPVQPHRKNVAQHSDFKKLVNVVANAVCLNQEMRDSAKTVVSKLRHKFPFLEQKYHKPSVNREFVNGNLQACVDRVMYEAWRANAQISSTFVTALFTDIYTTSYHRAPLSKLEEYYRFTSFCNCIANPFYSFPQDAQSPDKFHKYIAPNPKSLDDLGT